MNFLKKTDKNRNKLFAVLFVIGAIIYGVSPVDLIPDIAPLIGWSDDIVLNLIALINAYINWRKRKS